MDWLLAQRRGVLNASDVDRSLLDLEQLLAQMIQSEVALVSIRQSLLTARKFQLSSYDAAYLEPPSAVICP